MLDVIRPNWPAPKNVNACSTLRYGGISQGAFNSFNLATSVGDDNQAVLENRRLLVKKIGLLTEPYWLIQVHGSQVVNLPASKAAKNVADAAFSRELKAVCAVQTADCLPILLCDQAGTCVAAIHAGWRGLAHGIIEQTLKSLQIPTERLLAWLGPAIGPKAFEVGEDVYKVFVGADTKAAMAFVPLFTGKWLADIYLLARQRLQRYGVTAIYGGDYCTYSDAQNFFSYRRDKGQTGRMATLIWLEA